LGARWDATRKVWYVENKTDMAPFARWLQSGNAIADSSAISSKQPPAKKHSTAGITVVGSNYVEQPRICNCLPWDVCDLCRATPLNN
jgi:hypothetical protein